MNTLLKNSLSKLSLAFLALLFSSAVLQAQTVTINNSTSCAYEVTLKGANVSYVTSATTECTSMCFASVTTLTVLPGTTNVTLSGCPTITPVQAEVKQAFCVASPTASVEVTSCACGGGASTDSDSFTVPLSCCDPGATVTVDASCPSLRAMTIDIY